MNNLIISTCHYSRRPSKKNKQAGFQFNSDNAKSVEEYLYMIYQNNYLYSNAHVHKKPKRKSTGP